MKEDTCVLCKSVMDRAIACKTPDIRCVIRVPSTGEVLPRCVVRVSQPCGNAATLFRLVDKLAKYVMIH